MDRLSSVYPDATGCIMARASMPQENATLPTRVSVLEHGVQELKAGLDGHRGETRAAFASLQVSLDRMMTDVSKRATPTNWFGVLGSIAATVAIVGSIFALAEWRVSIANTPIIAVHQEVRQQLEKAQDQINDLKIRSALDADQHARMKTEADARIRARVEAEIRANYESAGRTPRAN